MRPRPAACFAALLILIASFALSDSPSLTGQTTVPKAKAKKLSYVLFPRKLEDIKKALVAIDNAPPPKGTEPIDLERDKALRRLKAYRYLAEVPYQNVTLDDQFTKLAEAGAALCAKIGKLDH